jgi:hypothetical protein
MSDLDVRMFRSFAATYTNSNSQNTENADFVNRICEVDPIIKESRKCAIIGGLLTVASMVAFVAAGILSLDLAALLTMWYGIGLYYNIDQARNSWLL